MSTSILTDVKHQLGLLPSDDSFDGDIMIAVNSAIATLSQLGVGPVEGFEIDTNTTWEQFVNDKRLNSVKSYIFLKVKLMFDPPGTGFVLQSMERQIQELEFRINSVVDYG
jgi:hypothetical protein